MKKFILAVALVVSLTSYRQLEADLTIGFSIDGGSSFVDQHSLMVGESVEIEVYLRDSGQMDSSTAMAFLVSDSEELRLLRCRESFRTRRSIQFLTSHPMNRRNPRFFGMAEFWRVIFLPVKTYSWDALRLSLILPARANSDSLISIPDPAPRTRTG